MQERLASERFLENRPTTEFRLVDADVAPERADFQTRPLRSRTVDAPTHSLCRIRLAIGRQLWPPMAGFVFSRIPSSTQKPNTYPAYETVVWDVVNNRQRGVLPGPYLQFAFSADGRSLAAEVLQQDCVRIFDLDSLAARANYVGPIQEFRQSANSLRRRNPCRSRIRRSPSDQHRGMNRTFINAGPYRAELPRGGLCVQTADLSCFDVATGKASIRAKLAQSQFAAGGHVLIANGGGADDEIICAYDTANGRIRYSIPRHPGEEWEVSPDGRTLLHIPDQSPIGPVEKVVRSIGLPWPFAPSIGYIRAQLYATIDGRHLGSIPARRPRTVDCLESPVMAFRWFPDGQTLATMPDPEHPNVWELWDIPPRKSLRWFALAAAVLALPPAGLAWRRLVPAAAGGGVMRLLPRSVRGTWLLATVVWAAACGVAWGFLLIRPRAVTDLAASGGMIGFTADSRDIYSGPVYSSLTHHGIVWLPGPTDHSLRYCDVETGRCRFTWSPTGREIAVNPAVRRRCTVILDGPDAGQLRQVQSPDDSF